MVLLGYLLFLVDFVLSVVKSEGGFGVGVIWFSVF